MAKKRTHVQYAALPFAIRDGHLHVMLITSRETGRWVIPKGWPIAGLDGQEVAAREAYEEAGLVGQVSPHCFAEFKYVKRMETLKRRRCTVQVYPLLVRQELDDWPERTQRKRQWMLPAEAAMRVAEQELSEMLEGLADLADAEKILLG